MSANDSFFLSASIDASGSIVTRFVRLDSSTVTRGGESAPAAAGLPLGVSAAAASATFIAPDFFFARWGAAAGAAAGASSAIGVPAASLPALDAIDGLGLAFGLCPSTITQSFVRSSFTSSVTFSGVTRRSEASDAPEVTTVKRRHCE